MRKTLRVLKLEKCSFVVIPKNASSSICEAIGKSIGMEKTDAKLFKLGHKSPAIAFIREPHDRAVSAWQQKCIDDPRAGNWLFKGLKSPCTFEDFISYLVSLPIEEMDQHLKPQSVLLEGIEDLELHRLDCIDEVWPSLQKRFGWFNLPKHNSTEHNTWYHYFNSISQELCERYDTKYRRDIELYATLHYER